jgi:hypothetical protein
MNTQPFVFIFYSLAQDNDWHVHNPYLGQSNPSEDDLLGYALDGFAIYGPLSDDSVLDDCNGRTVDGVYRYHVRVSLYFSYFNMISKIPPFVSRLHGMEKIK